MPIYSFHTTCIVCTYIVLSLRSVAEIVAKQGSFGTKAIMVGGGKGGKREGRKGREGGRDIVTGKRYGGTHGVCM